MFNGKSADIETMLHHNVTVDGSIVGVFASPSLDAQQLMDAVLVEARACFGRFAEVHTDSLKPLKTHVITVATKRGDARHQ